MNMKWLSAGALFWLGVSATSLAHPPAGGMLQKADTDGDGQVVKQEFEAARLKMFAALDRNQDGFLDDADREQGQQARAERGRRMHERMDRDEDGKVSREEFQAGGAKWFERADRDSNAVIDAQELQDLQERHGKRRHHGDAPPEKAQ